MEIVTWGEFARQEPELAEFGAARLRAAPAYLATSRRSGEPRVHPVTPILTDAGLYVFMEPTSPKGRDLRERGVFALHNGVPDTSGTGGEFFVRGRGALIEAAAVRTSVAQAASYDPQSRYILFELRLVEARGNSYGDVVLPEHSHWQAP